MARVSFELRYLTMHCVIALMPTLCAKRDSQKLATAASGSERWAERFRVNTDVVDTP